LVFGACAPDPGGAAVPKPGPSEGGEGACRFIYSELVPEVMVGTVCSEFELGVKFSGVEDVAVGAEVGVEPFS